jgi:two-component system response regulator DctR
MDEIKVLIVEDDPMVREIHKNYIISVEGFRVAGIASNGREALDIIRGATPDLVILDIFMPKLDGVSTLHRIRKQNKDIDVIVVTAAREAETVEEIMRFGAFDYIIKPFSFERISSALESYKRYREKMKTKKQDLSQEEVDGLINRNRHRHSLSPLPKGLNRSSLEKVTKAIRNSKEALSTDEVAALTDFSRVTAWRYLEFLVSSGAVMVKHVPHPNAGRPVKKYRFI